MSSRNGIIACVLVALLSAGCSSEPERPTEQLTRAKTLIEQAEKADAQRYAAAELESARNKLQTANKAADDGEQARATELATEAALDAELAAARAASGEAQNAAKEVGNSTEQLRQEAAPKPDADPARTPETATAPPKPEPGTSQR